MAHWLWGDRPEQEGLPRQDGDGPASSRVLSVNLAAATQASQGTVAAVVTTAVMVWALVLVVLEVRANRRGARCWQSGTAWTRRQGGTSTSDDAATQPACVQGHAHKSGRIVPLNPPASYF
jgi:hypothetical protein